MNIQKMIQEAQRAQQLLKKKLDEFDNKEFEYSSRDMITVKISGALEILDIKISDKIIDPEDPDTLQDLIIEAINLAIKETTKKKNEIANSIAPGLAGMM